MHAIILAGGFGTRLKSVVADVPKPMALVGGRPFLDLLIGYLAKSGVTRVTLSVHHLREIIEAHVRSQPFPIPVDVLVEETPLGTGGAMAYALEALRPQEPIIVLNGDSFVPVDYRKLYAAHVASGAALTLTLRQVPDTSRYSEVIVEDGFITEFRTLGGAYPSLINAGVYVMQPDLFLREPLPTAFSFERDFLPPRATVLRPCAFQAEDYFIDIGVPEDYARACRELPAWVS